MHYYLITPLKVVHGSQSQLTYHSEEELSIGLIVMVPVGKILVAGVIMSETKKPTFATKGIEKIVEQSPLPLGLLKLAGWMSEY